MKVADSIISEHHSTSAQGEWCYENQIRVAFTKRQQIGRLLWWIGNLLLIKCSLRPMYAWRRGVLRLFGAKIGDQASIQRSARIEFPWNLEIGRYSTIGENTWIFNLGKVYIEDFVTISQRVFLCTGTHDYTRPEFDLITKPVTIQRGAWIAADVYVGPGVTISRDAVIGARSVVVKDMPPGMVCVGHPCAPLKPRVGTGSS